jgi:hypothetical protein
VCSGPSWLCCARAARAGGSSAAPSPHGAPPPNRPGPCDPTCRRWGDAPAPRAWPVTSAPRASGLRLGSAARPPQPGLFFSRGPCFSGGLLLLRVAPESVRGRPVRPHAGALTAGPPRRALPGAPGRVIEGRRQCLIGPGGTGQSTTLRAVFPPPLERRGQRLGQAARLPRRPRHLSARHTVGRIRLEPQAYGGALHASILGARLPLGPSAGHQDRLAPLTQASVGGRLAGVVQCRLCCSCEGYPQHVLRSLSRGHETTSSRVPYKRCNITRRLYEIKCC